MSYLKPQPLLDRIVSWVEESSGSTAVHAGHFMLLGLRHSCVPAILEEQDQDDDVTRGLIENLIARFPLKTWQLGVQLISQLQESGNDAKLLTLVNDWYFLRNQGPDGVATSLRKEFYECQSLVPSYES
ncbi:MAG: hypothetical protein QF535_22220, partial [Anaerolineales bacterium]|nr:hypothetical protein [Anaerolineales bacterium]